MAVYVDPLGNFGGDNAPTCFRNKPSCHMYADSLEELHKMATAIGLRKQWFQDALSLQHYDLTPFMRKCAVKLGAVEHNRREAIKKWYELRQKRIDEKTKTDVV